MEVTVGDEIPAHVIATVDAGAMKTTALLLRDPNPIHWNVETVRRIGLGDRPVNQGPLNVGYVIDMLAVWLGDEGPILRLSCRFAGNVFAGDRLRAHGRVTSVDEDDGGRRATCDVSLVRGEDDVVLRGTAVVGLSRRSPAPAPDASRPTVR